MQSTSSYYTLSLHDALPIYTEMSLFARINEDGKLTLVNHLGIDLGETPEQILSKLDDDRIKDDDVRHDGRHAHDYDRSEEHTSELQSRFDLVCRLLLEKKNK